jgi:hypothetical protein
MKGKPVKPAKDPVERAQEFHEKFLQKLAVEKARSLRKKQRLLKESKE